MQDMLNDELVQLNLHAADKMAAQLGQVNSDGTIADVPPGHPVITVNTDTKDIIIEDISEIDDIL